MLVIFALIVDDIVSALQAMVLVFQIALNFEPSSDGADAGDARTFSII